MTAMHLRIVVSVSPQQARTGAVGLIEGWTEAGWSVEAIHLSANDMGAAVLRRSGDAESVEAEFARNLAGEVSGHDRGVTAAWTWRDDQPPPTLDLDALVKPVDHAQLRNLDLIRRSIDRLAEALCPHLQGSSAAGG